VRVRTESFANFGKAGFDATALGFGKDGEEAADFRGGAFGPAVEFLGAGEALCGFEGPGNEFHQLAVGFRAKFHEFGCLLPGVHVFRLPALLDEATWYFD
jgi:hypothetical protein